MSRFMEEWDNLGEQEGNEYGEEYGEYEEESEGKYQTTFEQEASAIRQKDIAYECASSINLPDKSDKNFRKMKAQLTPEDNFKYDVDKISQYLNDNSRNIKLDVNDRNQMCKLSGRINTINLLNACAFVVAYWVSNGNGIIIDKRWKGIYTNHTELINVNFGSTYESKSNVYPADVLRYVRFIFSVLNP